MRLVVRKKKMEQATSIFLFYLIALESFRGTIDVFAPIRFLPVLFSDALIELEKSILVSSLILSTYLFFCLSLLLIHFTVPYKIVLAKPEDVAKSLYSPLAAWVFQYPPHW